MAKKKQDATALVSLFRALADPTRLAIINMLIEGESNVSSLCRKLDIAQPSVSHHLAILRTTGVVHARRQGKEVHYSIRDLKSDASGRSLKRMLKGGTSLKIGPFIMGIAAC